MSILELYEHSWNPDSQDGEVTQESKIILYVTIGVCVPVIVIAVILVVAVCYQTSKIFKQRVDARRQMQTRRLVEIPPDSSRRRSSSTAVDAVTEAIRKVTFKDTPNSSEPAPLTNVTVVNAAGQVELASDRNFVWREDCAVGSLLNVGYSSGSDSEQDCLQEYDTTAFSDISDVRRDAFQQKYPMNTQAR